MVLEKDLTNRELGYLQHKCRICSAEGDFPTYRVREMFYGTREEFEYFSCPECNCLQIANIPDDMGKYYTEGYYSFTSVESTYAFPEEIADNTEILDVGCGSGKWLLKKAEEGCGSLYGCDPFIDEDKNYLNRIHIYKCTIHEIPGEKRFDLIRMGDSLEHMDDPEETLRDAARLLKDNGRIEISIPSWPNVVFDLFKTHWVQLDAPRHLWIPSVETIRFIADRVSLYVDETYCDSNEGAIMLSFFYEHGIPMKDMTDEMVRSFFSEDARKNIRQTIYDANKRGEGDHRIIVLKKKEEDDKELLIREFSMMGLGRSEYETSKSIEELVERQMRNNLYEGCFEFLKWLFFEKEDKSKAAYLSEGTMLQYLMLEASLVEKSRMEHMKSKVVNTCKLFDFSYKMILNPYVEIKHDIRRIWFGLPDDKQEVLIKHIKEYKVSPELLAIMIKYSIFPGCYKFVYEKVADLLSGNDMKEYGDILSQYGNMACKDIIVRSDLINVFNISEVSANDIEFRRIYLSEESLPADEAFLKRQKKDSNKFAIIFCTHSEMMEQECLMYLNRIVVPNEMKLEIISVWNAKGMCYGYNRAMRVTDAKYKLYIHHDSFILKQDILHKLKELFDEDKGWGLLGIAGSTVMEDNFFWASYKPELVRYNLYQDRIMETILSQSIVINGEVDMAKAVDGVLIATSVDVPWREDLFDGWHFYDISQCFEFEKRKYKVGLINEKKPWLLHETTATKDPQNLYEFYGKIFYENYLIQ